MFEFITFGLAVASMILHFVAPKTKNKLDDKAAEAVDEAEKVLPMVKPILGNQAAPLVQKVSGFSGATVTDHRTQK